MKASSKEEATRTSSLKEFSRFKREGLSEHGAERGNEVIPQPA